tara:strand:- start:384 stop:1769 length:1386 start_codon:yes stop_codon:yes gene_type:complete
MNIYIFDTLSKEKKKFIPVKENLIRIYACGPTVYDYAHVGNARMAVVTDLLVRVLKRKFKNVVFVSNITDIDDKIIKASEESKISINDLTNKFYKIYNKEMLSLNVNIPDLQPKATEHIDEMINMIIKLIENKCAYVEGNHVLFNVESYKHYGKLSRRSVEEQLEGSRIEVSKHKRSARDFVLWKPSEENQPGWTSPWGRGRPGWHIECSAMSKKCLGLPFDIHCGGVDLTFPHHENEIAQSCSAIKPNSEPRSFSKYWFHNGFVTFNGEKMSKSLGNIQLINTLLKKYSGETIRYSLLSAHYRQPLNWTSEILEQSKATLIRIYRNYKKIKNNTKSLNINKNDFFLEFQESLSDDLNTPKAFGILNKLVNVVKNKSGDEKDLITQAISESLSLLGFNHLDNFRQNDNNNDDEVIEKLIKDRNFARKNKDFKKADEIREILIKQDIEIEDTATGTKWTKLK